MPDITMCDSNNCPMSGTCYRKTAESNKFRQSYFTIPPLKEDNTCEYYWKVKNKLK